MAQYEDITIDQGSDVAIQLDLVNKDGSVKDLTNFQVAAKLKKSYNSDSADTLSFTAGVTDPENGTIILGLDNTQTDSLTSRRYVYDVEISFVDSSGSTIIERVLEGHIHVTPSVTR